MSGIKRIKRRRFTRTRQKYIYIHTIAFLSALLKAANCKTHYDVVTSYEAPLASIHSYVRKPRRFLVSQHEIASFAREFATVSLRFRNRGNSCCREFGVHSCFLRASAASHTRSRISSPALAQLWRTQAETRDS